MARPKLPEGEGKRVPLNMRTTSEMRLKLDEAASRSGRSLAQEVEARLEKSFSAENQINSIDLAISGLLGDSHNTDLAVRLIKLIQEVETGLDKKWIDADANLEPYNINLIEIINFVRGERQKSRRNLLARLLAGPEPSPERPAPPSKRKGGLFGLSPSAPDRPGKD